MGDINLGIVILLIITYYYFLFIGKFQTNSDQLFITQSKIP